MDENDILKRIERLEKDSHPPVKWQEAIEDIYKRLDVLSNLYAEIVNSLIKQRK